MRKIFFLTLLQLLFVSSAYAVEYDLPGVDEKNIPPAPTASVEHYMQFIFLVIILTVFATSLWVLATNARKYYNSQLSEEKDTAYLKMRDAFISMGVIAVSVLGLWALYPQYLAFSPSRISAIITALF